MSNTEDATVEALGDAFPGMQETTQEQAASMEATDQEHMTPELQALLDETSRDIINWIPDREGKQVAGVLADITDVDSDFHKDRSTVPMLIIRGPSGVLWGVRCYHSVLLNEVERRIEKGRLKVGDLIAIKYLGKGGAPDRAFEQYENYRLVVRPAQPAS